LKEAGAESLSFQLLNRNVDLPLKYVGESYWPGVASVATEHQHRGTPDLDLAYHAENRGIAWS
jgi:hypothetical protein